MTDPAKSIVCLNRCSSYQSSALQKLLHEQLDILAVPADLLGKKVLLKPNLISVKAPPLACSSPLFVHAAASCFLKRGATVCLGDSPAIGAASQVLQKQGFTSALSDLDIQYVPFKTVLKKPLACGVTVGVAAEALQCDLFVNLPRIKAHDQMGVTMAVKNVFGIVIGARKAWLHMSHGGTHAEFAEIILDLQRLLPPAVALADGIEVMSRRGPIAGVPLGLECIGASDNFVALDRALLALLQVDETAVPLAMAARAAGISGAFPGGAVFPQLQPDDFSNSGFRIPAVLNSVRFRPLHYLKSSLRKLFLSLGKKIS